MPQLENDERPALFNPAMLPLLYETCKTDESEWAYEQPPGALSPPKDVPCKTLFCARRRLSAMLGVGLKANPEAGQVAALDADPNLMTWVRWDSEEGGVIVVRYDDKKLIRPGHPYV